MDVGARCHCGLDPVSWFAEWLGHCDEQLGHWGGYLATLLGGESTLKKLLEYAVLMAVVGLVLDLDLAKVFQVIIPFAGALLLLPTFPRLEESDLPRWRAETHSARRT